jgi:hypothetical protein
LRTPLNFCLETVQRRNVRGKRRGVRRNCRADGERGHLARGRRLGPSRPLPLQSLQDPRHLDRGPLACAARRRNALLVEARRDGPQARRAGKLSGRDFIFEELGKAASMGTALL